MDLNGLHHEDIKLINVFEEASKIQYFNNLYCHSVCNKNYKHALIHLKNICFLFIRQSIQF